MPNFQYTALDAQGQKQTGVIPGANEAEATQALRAKGLYPTNVVPEGSGGAKGSKGGRSKAKTAASKAKGTTGGKVKPKLLMIFTRQLSTLLDSGLPLLRSLNVLGKQEPNPVLRGTINAIGESVQSGSTFSEALSQHPRLFNKLYVNMVKAGELGGVLEVVLDRLASYQEKAQKLKNKIVSAMVYPVIVLFIAGAILTFLLLFIVPKFEQMFTEMNIKLPAISEFVFGLSNWFFITSFGVPNFILVAVILVVGFISFKAYSKTKGGRKSVDALKLRLPLLGDVQRKSAISRFSRTLGTLVTSGVPILQALNITRDTAGNVVISEAIEKIHTSVKEGESIVTPMQSAKVFPPMVISMVDVGEETGQLPEMLLKIADVYDDEVDNSVSALTSLLEPMMIVFLAVVVGGIVFALFLPLLEVIQNMDGA